MSYILEALRRADAERERERGVVPDVHAQARPMPDAADDARRGMPPWVWLAAGAGLAAVLAAAAWWALRGGDEPAPPAAPALAGRPAPAVVPVAPPAQVAPPPPAATVPRAEVPAGPASPATVQPPRVAVTPSPAPARVLPPPMSMPPPGAATPVRPLPNPAPPPVRQTATDVAPGVPEAAASAAPPRVLRLAELPDTLRREWPQLAIGGSVHSSDPAGRMLVVNGQILREGETAAPGLVVEQIRPKSVVFTFKGQRVEMPL